MIAVKFMHLRKDVNCKWQSLVRAQNYQISVMKSKGAKPMHMQGSKSTSVNVLGLNEDKGKWLAKRKSERQRVESTRLRDSVKL